jgi:hypothetical protein
MSGSHLNQISHVQCTDSPFGNEQVFHEQARHPFVSSQESNLSKRLGQYHIPNAKIEHFATRSHNRSFGEATALMYVYILLSNLFARSGMGVHLLIGSSCPAHDQTTTPHTFSQPPLSSSSSPNKPSSTLSSTQKSTTSSHPVTLEALNGQENDPDTYAYLGGIIQLERQK